MRIAHLDLRSDLSSLSVPVDIHNGSTRLVPSNYTTQLQAITSRTSIFLRLHIGLEMFSFHTSPVPDGYYRAGKTHKNSFMMEEVTPKIMKKCTLG